MRKLVVFLFVFLVLTVGLGLYVRRELHVPGSPAEGLTIEIPRGLGAREVVGLLKEKNVIDNRYVALAYIFLGGTRHRLQAGEYLFRSEEHTSELQSRVDLVCRL